MAGAGGAAAARGALAAAGVGGVVAGVGGSIASGGAAAPAAGWIDPDLLEIKFQDCVCALCLGVMVEPTSGCPEGHSFCKPCYGEALEEKRECPTCRRKVDKRKLVRMRPLENIIAGGGGG